MKLITIPVHEDIDKIKAQLLEDTGIDMTYSQVFNWLIHFYKQRKPLTVWREDMTLKLLPHAAGDLMPATLVYTVKEVDKLQSAEIEGWKKDQKENLRNQCDLHAEIERLSDELNQMKTWKDNMRDKMTQQTAEIERVTTSATQNAEAAVKAEAALEAALQSEQQAVADERAKWEQELIDVNEDARNYQAVHNQWLNKTQWVQDDIQSGRLPVEYLGLHRADVIRLHTDALRAEIQKLRSNHERLQKLVDEGSASGLAYTASLELEAENQKLRDALESIALAGMSGSGQESEEGIRNWHAHRAWEFIGIAARALGETK